MFNDDHTIRIAIVGSRSFTDYNAMKGFICANVDIEKVIEIVSGGANGADLLGERFAREFNISTRIFLPRWKTHGNKAALVRNHDIIKNADTVFVFWDGSSRGTAHSIGLCEKYEKKTFIYRFRRPLW